MVATGSGWAGTALAAGPIGATLLWDPVRGHSDAVETASAIRSLGTSEDVGGQSPPWGKLVAGENVSHRFAGGVSGVPGSGRGDLLESVAPTALDPGSLATRPVPAGVGLRTPRQLFRRVWFGGTRDDAPRRSPERTRWWRSVGASVIGVAGAVVVLGGGVHGSRRQGAAASAPLQGAGAQLGSELSVVAGAAALFTGVMVASGPLEGGVRRLRPQPIGGRKWGGLALRWRW